MNLKWGEVIGESLNLRVGQSIIVDSLDTLTANKLLLEFNSSKQPVCLNIQSLSPKEQSFLISMICKSTSSFPFLQLSINQNSITQISLSKHGMKVNLKHYKSMSTNDSEVVNLQQLIHILQALEVEQKPCNKLLLHIKNAGQLTNYCMSNSLNSKDVLKLILFKEYNAEAKTIQSYYLKECKENIRNTIRVLEQLIAERVNKILSQKCTMTQRGTDITLYFSKRESQKIQSCVHTNLSHYLTASAPIPQCQVNNSPYLQLLIIPIKHRTNHKILSNLSGVSPVRSDYRLYRLFKEYISIRVFQKSKKRVWFNRLKNTITSYSIASDVQNMILDRVVTITQQKEHNLKQCHQSLLTLSRYLPTIPNLKSYSKSLSSSIHRSILSNYILAIIPLSRQQSRAIRRSHLIHKLQLNFRAHLIRKQLIRDLYQSPQDPLPDKHYQPLISSFNSILNRCNRLREVQKKAFISLQVLSVKNNTSSDLFSSSKLLEFIKDCSSKFKGDESIQRITVTDASITFLTNYRKSTYGIESESPPPYKHSGCNYRMVLNSEGALYAMGENGFGELGVGDYKSRETFAKVLVPGSVSRISCGAKQSICMTSSNDVFVWGLLKQEGKKSCINTPQRVALGNDTQILDIESSNYNSFTLMDNKQVMEINNRVICYKQTSVSAIPFQIICLRSNTLQIVVIKKIDFSGVSLSLKKKKEILGEFRQSRVSNKENLGKIPLLVNKSYNEYFNSQCIATATAKENDDNNLLQ